MLHYKAKCFSALKCYVQNSSCDNMHWYKYKVHSNLIRSTDYIGNDQTCSCVHSGAPPFSVCTHLKACDLAVKLGQNTHMNLLWVQCLCWDPERIAGTFCTYKYNRGNSIVWYCLNIICLLKYNTSPFDRVLTFSGCCSAPLYTDNENRCGRWADVSFPLWEHFVVSCSVLSPPQHVSIPGMWRIFLRGTIQFCFIPCDFFFSLRVQKLPCSPSLNFLRVLQHRTNSRNAKDYFNFFF